MLKTKKGAIILSLLVVVMTLSLAFGVKLFTPNLVVYASDEHVHCFCGNASCSEDLHDSTLVWTEWDAKTDLTTAGNYYLADSVETDEVTKNVVVSNNVNLCLCGKTLNLGTYSLIVENGATLTISDCVGGGTIAAARPRSEDGRLVVGTVELSGKLNVYSGTLTHVRTDTTISKFHCAINVDVTGELNVFGGTITGEKSLSINNLGTVVIDGGLVTSSVYNGFTYTKQSNPVEQKVINPATAIIKSGEINCFNAVVNAGTLNVEGGTISASSGYAVELNFYSALNVTGGTISSTSNTCVIMKSVSVGNTYYQPNGTITMSGGTITTSASGSSTYNRYAIEGKNLHVSGGTISNTSQDASYAINLVGDLYLSGNPLITTATNYSHILYTGTNIYANDGKSTSTYYEGEELKLRNNRSIGSKLYQPVVYGLKNEAQGKKFILDDYEKHYLAYENNQLILLPEHGHCIGACNTCTDATHKISDDNGFDFNIVHRRNNEINFQSYTTSSYLPYESYFQGGNFESFLDCDINTTSDKNRITGTSFLCLNGHSVDGQNRETISQTGTLVITDCTGEGSIKNIIIADGGTLRVYNGRIGEITVQDGAKLLLFGGIYAQKFENATIPAGYGWVKNNDSATKEEYPYKITSVKTITFNSNGADGEMENQVVEVGVESTLNSNEFTMQGYEFGGWTDSVGGAKLFDNLANITISNDITLYAIWNAKTDTPYQVKHYFENLAGEFILDENKTQSLFGTTASTITATHLTGIAGFEPDLDNAESFASSTILPNGNLVLKLYYVRTMHTVTVAINNASFGGVDNPIIQNVKYGTQITINKNVVTVGNQTITATPATQTSTNSFYFVNITGGNITVDNDLTFTANFITRLRVNKPSLDNENFIYDGTEKTYDIPSNDNYVVNGNKQTEVGTYQVTVSLIDKNGSEWEDGTDTDLIYEFIIKAGEQSYVDENSVDKSKPSVVVSSPNGIAPDISLVVTDKTQDEAVIEKIPAKKNSVVQKIYDISLERNGDNVQVSEVGGLITIKILIGEELKADDIKLYHIHGDENGVEIKRGNKGVVNEYVIEGDYAIITIDRLSEFAFVKEPVSNYWWLWLIGAVVVVALTMVVLAFNVKKNNTKKGARKPE